jgi:hypothetical protein
MKAQADMITSGLPMIAMVVIIVLIILIAIRILNGG